MKEERHFEINQEDGYKLFWWCECLNSSSWTALSGSGAEDVRVMTRKSIDDPGRPPGIILNAMTSFRAVSSRSEWDILSNGGVVEEVAHIANGGDHGNYVSLLRVNEERIESWKIIFVLCGKSRTYL
ncbi:uncharacterized protein A4U43_C08F26050 [Asparagus officinalis]|nr:uncharacterized protein A4U43_C08F26050 [Asparagus officinalis]